MASRADNPSGPDRPDFHREGSGEPLVLLHGIGSTWTIWRRIIPALAERFDVLALDFPGFGTAPELTDSKPSIPNLARWAGERAAQEGFERPHVVGHSMGGWTAIEMGRLGLARDVLALSPPGAWGSASERFVFRFQLAIGRIAARAVAPRAESLLRFRPVRWAAAEGNTARPMAVAREDLAEAVPLVASARGFRGASRWMSSNTAASLEQIDCPVTIAHGKQDRVVPHRIGERWAAGIPGARFVLLSDQAHTPMLDDPDAVRDLILKTVGKN